MPTDGQLAAQQKFLEMQSVLSAALAMSAQLNSRTSVLDESASSFDAAILDAIFEIDSEPDVVDPFLDSSMSANRTVAELGSTFTIGASQSPYKTGKLQRIRSMKVALFGGKYRTTGAEGQEETKVALGLLEELRVLAATGGTASTN